MARARTSRRRGTGRVRASMAGFCLRSVPSLGRDLPESGRSLSLPAAYLPMARVPPSVRLSKLAMGILCQCGGPKYQSVSRSLKYVLLFIGLLFLSYFVFEVTTGKRVHPAQYVLVGIAHMIFYLLLLSLAERIGFDWGFLVGGGATVALFPPPMQAGFLPAGCRDFARCLYSACSTSLSTCCCGSRTMPFWWARSRALLL